MFDPVLLSLGPIQIRWYGIMYVVGFIIGGWLWARLSDEGFFRGTRKDVDKFITYIIIWMFVGSRLAYVFIYNWDYYSQNLGEVFAIWKGGLSFHGALAGILLTSAYLAKKHKMHWLEVFDCLAYAGSLGLFFGRMGNFINGELYGRVTTVPWGMVFPGAGPYPRHPSQLYEGVAEGLLLFILIWALKKKVKIYGLLGGIWLVGYAVARFCIEFFREPDAQLGYYGPFTMGQILCAIMVGVGVGVTIYAKKQNVKISRMAPTS